MDDFEEAKKEWVKLGYTDEEATELAKVAMPYKEIGIQFNNVEDAITWLLEAMKADLKCHGESVELAYRIIDKFNAIDLGSPVPYEDIIAALEKISN